MNHTFSLLFLYKLDAPDAIFIVAAILGLRHSDLSSLYHFHLAFRQP